MFIKIKLEPQSLKALSPLKNISYFSIDDDATIINLKMKIEEYVDVPAERQEIRTLTKVFQNNLYVKEVCDVRGSAIMLYAYDEDYEYDNPQFVCFLQVYTDELAVQQQELENRSKMPKGKLTTPTSSTSSVTLIADSDTEGDSEETDTETCSSKNSVSDGDSSTDNSDSSCGKKRGKTHGTKNATQNKKLKVTAPSGSQYSETLREYLDEFPKCSNQLNPTEENKASKPAPTKGPNKETISYEPALLCKTTTNEKTIENKNIQHENTNTQSSLEPTPLNNSSSNSNSNNKIQSNKITTTKNKSNNSNNIHPCYAINPEIRDYLAIITSNDMNSIIGNVECEELLVWFFDRFRACDSSSHLQFDNKTAITLFEGKLWIACMNISTFEWISTNITKYSLKSYKILALKDSKHSCEVVVPVVSHSKNVLDIFDLLEKQNKNITTLKWSLNSRQALTAANDKDFNEKAISAFCTNEMFNIVMDTESRECLEKLDFKLKYCFWQIVFKFL